MSILTELNSLNKGDRAVIYVSPYAEFAWSAACRGDFLECEIEECNGMVAQLRCARELRPWFADNYRGMFEDEISFDVESPFFLSMEEFEKLRDDREDLAEWLKTISRTIWHCLQSSEKPHYQDILYDYARSFKLKRKKLIRFD